MVTTFTVTGVQQLAHVPVCVQEWWRKEGASQWLALYSTLCRANLLQKRLTHLHNRLHVQFVRRLLLVLVLHLLLHQRFARFLLMLVRGELRSQSSFLQGGLCSRSDHGGSEFRLHTHAGARAHTHTCDHERI